jgi:hypothetical protein
MPDIEKVCNQILAKKACLLWTFMYVCLDDVCLNNLHQINADFRSKFDASVHRMRPCGSVNICCLMGCDNM